MWDFYVISMKVKGTCKSYLMCGETEKAMKWTFDRHDACWFETYDDAMKFGKEYFKHFDQWEVEGFDYFPGNGDNDCEMYREIKLERGDK